MRRLSEEELAERSINYLVEKKVKEELAKYQVSYRRVSTGWLELRDEIKNYILSDVTKITGMGYQTCENAFFNPIKLILRVRRIDDISDEQAVTARYIYKYIRTMLERNNEFLNFLEQLEK